MALKRHPVVFGLAGTHFLTYLGHQVLPSTWVLYTGFRYGWGPKETGISLAVVGLMAGIVQGGLTKRIVHRLGEQNTLIFGLVIAALAYIAYGLAPQGWMIYAIICWGFAWAGWRAQPFKASSHVEWERMSRAGCKVR